MEQLPELGQSTSFELAIPVHSCFFDHAVNGKPVLPAVEAMEILTGFASNKLSSNCENYLFNASFGKFLPLSPQKDSVDAIIEVERVEDSVFKASLQTKVQYTSGISRRLTHASVHYTNEIPPLTNDLIEIDIQPTQNQITAAEIYRDIIPFGKNYQNLRDPIEMTPQHVTSGLYSGAKLAGERKLGSPFTLDAAFHSACAWGERLHQKVIYPIGFGKRYIPKPTSFESSYKGVVIFKETQSQIFLFDLFILDMNGNLREVVFDLQMKEIPA